MIDNQHIVSAFDRDLEGIQGLIMKMGGLVEASISKSVLALKTADVELATAVHKGDAEVDALEDMVNQEAARVIALRTPTASDLRTVLTVFKIAANLERIGDYSKNIAKRSKILLKEPKFTGGSAALERLAAFAEPMLRDVLDAYIQRDAALAGDVRARDSELDALYETTAREFSQVMAQDSAMIDAGMRYHFMAKDIERMGDHVTAIAEQVIYLVEGSYPDDDRRDGIAG